MRQMAAIKSYATSRCGCISQWSQLEILLVGMQESSKGLVYQELHVAPDEAVSSPHGWALQLWLRIRHVQVALMAAQAGRSLIPGQRFLRYRLQKCHLAKTTHDFVCSGHWCGAGLDAGLFCPMNTSARCQHRLANRSCNEPHNHSTGFKDCLCNTRQAINDLFCNAHMLIEVVSILILPFSPLFGLQTDKQRIIWAYKILFLDVLFPLNLRKVIFVDSDQIIRADFAELWNMDLKVDTHISGQTFSRNWNHLQKTYCWTLVKRAIDKERLTQSWKHLLVWQRHICCTCAYTRVIRVLAWQTLSGSHNALVWKE